MRVGSYGTEKCTIESNNWVFDVNEGWFVNFDTVYDANNEDIRILGLCNWQTSPNPIDKTNSAKSVKFKFMIDEANVCRKIWLNLVGTASLLEGG